MAKIIDTLGKYLIVALITLAMFIFFLSVERKPLLADDNTSFVRAVVDAYSLNGYLYGANCKVGTRVIASLSEYDGSLSANVYNYDRENEIWVLLAAFFGLMWLVGGKKGFNSILALIFTFATVIFLYIPLMYIGVSPE